MAGETDIFKYSPHKAIAKIKTNETLMAVCLTLFVFLFTLAPEKLTFFLLIQFILAVPLFYISDIAYVKLTHKERATLWEYLGWFTGTAAIALTLNILGILIYLLGFIILFYIYFGFIWFLLLIYTTINIYYYPKSIGFRIFKFIYFVMIQMVLGTGITFF